MSCDLLNPQTGGLLFPPDALNPETEPATCVRLEDYQLGEIVFNCPPPTEFNIAESRYAVSACRYPCEYLLSIAWEHGWTDMRPLWITASVLNWFSFVSVIITILVFALVPKLRQWPTRIVIFMGIGLFFFHLGFIGNTFFSFSDLECANHWDFEYGSWCKFQSWTMVFGAMLTACWWVVQAFVVWWNVGLLKLKDPLPKKLEPFFHVVCWLYPILCSFLVAWVPSQSATGGGLTGNPFCTFSESDIGVTWGVFVGVLIFQLTLVFFFLSWTVIRILITPSAEGNWLKAFGRRLPQQLLIITFCFVFLNVIVATVAQVSWSRDQNESLTNALTDLLVCHLTTLGDPADCSAPRYNNPSIYWYLTISTSTCGLFFGIIFLIMRGDTRKEVISSVTSRSAGSTHTGNTSGNTGGSSN
ncbi:MAG: hypothetical protein Q8P67_00570 [archaeon]|nr:hypothetical protein [archaeon]